MVDVQGRRKVIEGSRVTSRADVETWLSLSASSDVVSLAPPGKETIA